MSALVLTEDQQQYLKLAQEFAVKELAASAHRYDVAGEVAHDILSKASEIGLTNVCLPEKFGGLSLKLLDACLIAEELAAGCAGIAAPIEASNIAVQALIDQGSDEQKARYLEPLTSGEPAFAGLSDNLLVVEGRSSVSAAKEGDTILLSGAASVFNASFAKWLLISARADDSGQQLTAIIRTDQAGVSVGDRLNRLGRRAADVRRVILGEVRVAACDILPAASRQQWLLTIHRAQCLLAAGAIGLARQAMEHSIKYSRERRAFGRPLFEHQAVAFMIADMAKDIEAARLLTWQAAEAADRGQEDLVSSLMARSFAQDTAMRVTLDAVQIFGGYGYSREYPVEKLMRDAKVYQVGQGDTHALKAFLGRELVASA